MRVVVGRPIDTTELDFVQLAGALFEGLGGRRPLPLKEKEKKKKGKKKKKKREKREKRKKGTINNVKLLYIKCCFSNFSIVQWHWEKKFGLPKKKLK